VFQIRNRQTYFFWLTILLLLFVHLMIRVILMRQGFVSVSADEFARGIRSAEWAANPTFSLRHFSSPWLPLEMYLNGFGQLIWPNPFWVPRFTVFLASCLTLLGYIWLNLTLFESYISATINAFLLLLFHWFAWLSATPMLEMYYLPFYIIGLVFFLRFLDQENSRAWLYCGLCFAIATGVHIQSWLIVASTLICTIPFALHSLRKDAAMIGSWVGMYLLAVSVVAFSLFAQWHNSGKVLSFLGTHTTYSHWFYDGYNVSLFQKAAYYPKIVVEQMPSSLWLMVVFGLWVILQNQSFSRKIFPLVLSIFILTVFSVSNIQSGPPSAAPNRYSMLHIGFLLLYGSYGLWQFIALPQSRIWWRRCGVLVLAGGLMISYIMQQSDRILAFPSGMSPDPVLAGGALRDLHTQNGYGKTLVELAYWEFLAVKMMAGVDAQIVFDRERIITERDLPSDLLPDLLSAQAYLDEHDIRYAVLMQPELRQLVDNAGFGIIWEGERWAIYERE
jgi:hypothetical protein